MADDNVTPIPINKNGNDWYHWEVYNITPKLSGFDENLSHEKNTSLYYEKVRK